MTEANDLIDIFIRYIYAAVEADLAVNDQNLSVVTVIVMCRDEGCERREHLGLDAYTLEHFRVIVRQRRKCAHAVVHDADLYSLGGLALQNSQDRPPHFPLIDNEVFHENEMLCLLELDQHVFPLVFPKRIVGDLVALCHRVGPGPVQVGDQIPCLRAVSFQIAYYVLILNEVIFVSLEQLFVTFSYSGASKRGPRI